MKKLYTTAKYKQRQRRIAKRVLNKKHSQNNKPKKSHITNDTKKTQIIYKKQKNVTFPKNFSLVNNPEETLTCFQTLEKVVKKRHKIYLDSSKVTTITIDSILYLIAQFQHFKKKYNYQNFNGNLPKLEDINQFFTNSGFANYVKGISNNNNNIFSGIKVDNQAQPKLADDVKTFVSEKTNYPKNVLGDFYNSIIEAMSNTANHTNSYWYMCAFYNTIKKQIEFCFLDKGPTIPKTVRKKLLENFRINGSNSDLIKSTLLGAFRTRTKEKNRGRGLPQIFSQSIIKDFSILSNKGLVKKNNDKIEQQELNKEFQGTLYYWIIKKNE